jgi:NACHT domain
VKIEDALELLNNLLFDNMGQHLDENEIVVLKAAWDDLSYQDVAALTPYSENKLRTYVSRKLFHKLTAVLGRGEKVTKKSFRRFVEELYTKHFSTMSLNIKATLAGNPPDVSNFYGRVPLLQMLKETVLENRCVVLRGVAGIGKSALAAKLICESLPKSNKKFEFYIWKSLHYAPSLEDLLTECICILGEPEQTLAEGTQAKISQLIKLLSERRCLLVFDSAESILQGERIKHLDQYGLYSEYGVLLRRIIEEASQSCVLLTSREPFRDIVTLHNKGLSSNTIIVEGLGKDALPILEEKNLSGQKEWGELVDDYRGNPLALRMVTSRIQKFFGGDVVQFRMCETTFVPDIFKSSLDDYFGDNARLSPFEQKVMYYLANELGKKSDVITLSQLITALKPKDIDEGITSLVIEALETLMERSLIETRIKDTQSLYGLQPVIKKYLLRKSVGESLIYPEKVSA